MPQPARTVEWQLRDLERRKTDRTPWDRRWAAQRKHFGPDDARFDGKKVPQGQRDRRVTTDTYGIVAARRMSNFLYNSVITPSASFDMGAKDIKHDQLSQETRKWYADERDAIYADMLDLKSGLQEAVGGVCIDLKYGNAWMVTFERPGEVPFSRHAPLGCVWAAEDKYGQISRFYWPQEFRAEEAMVDWGKDAGPSVVEACESEAGREKLFEFVWFCERNQNWNPHKGDRGSMRWRSGWLAVKDKHLVEEFFSHTPAFQDFRMLRTGGEMYAVGPADDCLEEIRMAQRVRAGTIGAVEKHNDPTTLVADDGVLTMTTQEARGEIVVRADLLQSGRPPIQQLQPYGNPQYGMELTKQIHEIIDQHFHRRLIELPREPRMTVDQILGIQEEAARGTAPLVLPLMVGLSGVVMRYHDLRRRDGRVAPAPDEAAKHTLQVKFTSPLAKAAMIAGVNAFLKGMELGKSAMQLDQMTVIACDWVRGLRDTLLALGVDPALVPGIEQLERMRKQMQERAVKKDGIEDAKNVGVAARQMTPAAEFISKLFSANDDAGAEAA